MKIKCDYCGNMIEETEGTCPSCGAPLSGVNRMADAQPKTIEELQEWYVAHHLPPENVTRFFIGKNITEPKAFGIYQDENGDFVVYKNKADGSRAVRYKGGDEGYAVNELYQRLKSEIANQKSLNASRQSGSSGSRSYSGGSSGGHAFSGDRQQRMMKKIMLMIAAFTIIPFIIGVVILIIFNAGSDTPSHGYYRYHNTDYYYQDSSWYYYDNTSDDWYQADSSDNISEVITYDNDDEYRIYNHDGKSFEDSTWYNEPKESSYESDNDSGWDSGSDWGGSDSWDSGGTDWGSDW